MTGFSILLDLYSTFMIETKYKATQSLLCDGWGAVVDLVCVGRMSVSSFVFPEHALS